MLPFITRQQELRRQQPVGYIRRVLVDSNVSLYDWLSPLAWYSTPETFEIQNSSDAFKPLNNDQTENGVEALV